MSILTTTEALPNGFHEREQLISFNTTKDGGPDEYSPPDNLGLHLYGEHGFAVHSEFLLGSDEELDNVILNVAYVHKNDYAAAYDTIDCWRGNRWENACDRGGTTFLDNYGGYPHRDEGIDDTTEDEDGDTPPPFYSWPTEVVVEAPPKSRGTTGGPVLGYITDHTATRVTNGIFQSITVFPHG